MANHNITIARASFAAACLRPDITSLTREDVSKFHNLLENVVSKCNPSNVQTCKEWLLENVVLSSQRSTALGKYLVANAKAIKASRDSTSNGRTSNSIARQQLHVLYTLNDLLHHIKYHGASSGSSTHFVACCQAQLPELFELTRSDARKRVTERLDNLLGIWEQEQYFTPEVLDQLRKGTSGNKNGETSNTSDTTTAVSKKETPYVMPATHGDPALPYYDLPAANLMPHIVPNRSVPMRPEQIRALQLSSGPADENLVNAVKDFLKDIERMDGSHQSLEVDEIVAGMDDLGQVSYHNEADDVIVDTYYGWSKNFCEKMKKRGTEKDDDQGQGRSRSYTRSRERTSSLSRSRSPFKRRRGNSRSRSPSYRYRFRNRSEPRSPDRETALFQQKYPSSTFAAVSSQLPLTFNGQQAPHPPFLQGSNNIPIPSRPPNYHGPWPPPPPPPPPSFAPSPQGYLDTRFPPAPQFYPGPSTSAYPHSQSQQ